MTFHQFTKLPEDMKAKELWSDGTNVGERTCGRHTLFLYQIHSFYAEVVYDNALNDIIGLRTFMDTALLEPYLKDIQLPEVN
jgi:hypothetical protein